MVVSWCTRIRVIQRVERDFAGRWRVADWKHGVALWDVRTPGDSLPCESDAGPYRNAEEAVFENRFRDSAAADRVHLIQAQI